MAGTISKSYKAVSPSQFFSKMKKENVRVEKWYFKYEKCGKKDTNKEKR